MKTVQENLGHATAAFTLDVYGHVTEKMKKDSADRMQAFIKSASEIQNILNIKSGERQKETPEFWKGFG